MPTILVVDDEPVIRSLVRAALTGSGQTPACLGGYRLLEAADGASALQLARSQRPDLILLDLALPGLSGLEVCQRLRAEPATAAIPILLLTGLAPQAERRAAWEAGARGCIAKPFSPTALLEQIAQALRQPAATSPG